uniref:L domain-like protein n=1 Tax=Melanopsichium pennsylvanicum 4 TaxID=1398559 RepID=A0A077R140_9BASI|nr:l domain-like protein [Melanopsichium pennsylvanicum 4]
MDIEKTSSFVSASGGLEDPTTFSTTQQLVRPNSPPSRSPSVASTATERPTLQLNSSSSYPPKPPSVDSNFSSVQGKTAGTPPDQQDDASVDDILGSVWDNSRQGKIQPEDATSAPSIVTASRETDAAPLHAAPFSRPDWMTDDLDESWPEEEPAVDSTPTPANVATISNNEARAKPDASQHDRTSSPARSDVMPNLLATPSVASRPQPAFAAISSSLPDPAFSAARHQARRALLKTRASNAGAPTSRMAPSVSALQAGPSTPSLRLPSHQNPRRHLHRSNADNEDGDSTIWSESESDSDFASDGSVPVDFASARGSLVESSRVTDMQTIPQSRAVSQHQATSPTPASDASGATGTFIHKADESSLPPVLRPVWQSPAKGQHAQKGKAVTALGGDLFTPMRLQTMFKTPTPPEKPMQIIMSAVATAANPYTIHHASTGSKALAPTAGQTDTQQQDNHRPISAATEKDAIAPSSAEEQAAQGAGKVNPPASIGLPSTAFTFQSPHASLRPCRGMVPSQSLQNMQTLHPNGMHATALVRPASAAAHLGLHTPAIPGSAAILLSGPPTPHTPMRLFKFNYDNAVTRAELEKMVNQRTPVASQEPQRAVDVERERKRLRLDVKPRKVLTGDLMSLPMLGETAPSRPGDGPHASSQQPQNSDARRQPLVDYVKESTDFMSALQDAVRVQSAGPDTSPEWSTEDDESSGAGAQQGNQVSFNQGKPNTSVTTAPSPARRRPPTAGSRQRTPQREDVVPSAFEHGSPRRLSSRRLPADSSFITESSSNDIPMSSTLKSRASLSRQLAAQVEAGESPRKLLRRISAAAIAEDEVEQEFDGRNTQNGAAWQPTKLAEDAIAYRDQQIRQLEERIARRRQLLKPARANVAAERFYSEQEPRTVQRPQMITLHEPTLDAITSHRQARGTDDSVDESDVDESMVAGDHDAQGQQDGNTRRFQDGIVLYDSERIPDPPLPDPTRTLRNVASAVELRNREDERIAVARATSLLALPTLSQPTGAAVEGSEPPPRRGDRTASSNTLVDPSNARTISGDVGSQLTLSDLGGKGATITRTGSLFNISQIPEQEIESLGRGKLKFNNELHRWEKVPKSRSSQEDLRSAARSGNDVEGVPTSKTPIPAIPEASAELSKSIDVFSESAEEQQARALLGGRTNSFQQRLGNASSNNRSAADGRQSDSSDPFRDFESFGQSSRAPASVSGEVDGEDKSTPKPVESHMFVSNRQYGIAQTPTLLSQVETGPAIAQNSQPQRDGVPIISSVTAVNDARSDSISANMLAPRPLPISTVPRSSSSLRNVVTYSPESTTSSRHSTFSHHAYDAREAFTAQRSNSPSDKTAQDDAQSAGIQRSRENTNANLYATPDRRLARTHQHHLGTPTPRASISSNSTPKSILKQPTVFRSDVPNRLSAANDSENTATPNRTISFADPPSTAHARARELGLAPSAWAGASGLHARGARDEEEDVDLEDDRTQAISSALKLLADLTLCDDSAIPASQVATTPSKMRDLDSNRSHWSYRTLRRPRRNRHESGDQGNHSSQQAEETYDELHGYPDMTLLTDASFNFAHDKVLEAITDVEPWEPGWDELQAIDLSKRRLESCVRLKEFLPALEEVDLQGNELSYLTGIPASVRVLNVLQNRLTSMASFGHLLHLEELNISNNQVSSLSHFSCLKHLHTLKADHNAISSLDGIDRIRSLVHVSLSSNRLKGVNLATTQWAGLESLDVSHNQLISIRGLSLMQRIKSLNLDHNDLNMVDLSPTMPRLRVLRVSGNVHLQRLDVAPAKRLRTLYTDYCDLDKIENLDQLEHLDNLSMRQQVEAAIVWPADQLRDVRRLFLSGNAFPQGISTTVASIKDARKPLTPAPSLTQPLRFLNLVYLELSACQLTHLPEDLSELAPNLRSLNLDHNLVSTLPSLGGMQRLKRLSLVGCRVKKSKSIITAVRGLGELQVLDCRTNPCTLGLYAPLIAPSVTPMHRGGEDASSPDLDVQAPSWLPPIPNAQITQPDLAARQQRKEAQAQREQLEQLEKSQFHKRCPPMADYAVNPDATLAKEAWEKRTKGAQGATYSSLFLAADARFKKTLPKPFRERRLLHRGLLAMACVKLMWIDGLAVEDEEIEEAEILVQSHRFDRAPVA